MTAVLVKAWSDLRRRRLQAAVIFLTVFLSMAAGTMAVTLMSQTRSPYEAAFNKQRGAHLQVGFTALTDPKLLARTPAAIGASAFGGPYPVTNIQFKFGDRKFYLDAVGRDNPGGLVEVLNVTSGRWVHANDEIVLTRSFAELNKISVGDRLKVVSVAATPTLTVVGEVVDIDEGSADLSSQRAWVLAAAAPALSTPDSSYYLMDYRFAGDPTAAQLQGHVDRLQLPVHTGCSDEPRIGGSCVAMQLRVELIRGLLNLAAPLPALDDLLSAERDQHTNDNDADFADESAPAVQRFRNMKMCHGLPPEDSLTDAAMSATARKRS